MFLKIFFIVFLWLFAINMFLFFGIFIFALRYDFLGGGISNYLNNPYPYAWLNFDGEHYLSIASNGYQNLKHFFFPLYPFIISFLNNLTGDRFENLAYIGLFVSYFSLIFALYGIIKIIKLDFRNVNQLLFLFFILLFPTSFYFASFYTESLFLLFSVWAFYFIRKKRWFLAGIFCALSTATRITGIALIPVLLVEFLLSKQRFNARFLFGLFIAPLGLFVYMAYLFLYFGDPFLFAKNLGEVFGEQRAGTFILFPQILYRYFFKIIPNLDLNYLPFVYTVFLELFSAIFFIFGIVLLFIQKKFVYAFYSALIFVLSTFSGSFSSLPRYVLTAFPVFIVYSTYFSKVNKSIVYVMFISFFAILGLTVMLFTRGYWIS
ncbi:MAG: hypothetical protein N2558_00550 [Patescibacteria group bacterium]|nr:hypothetical protein [Patescibacteria group bacterium]